jgi:excisionase family DNA binding protein
MREIVELQNKEEFYNKITLLFRQELAGVFGTTHQLKKEEKILNRKQVMAILGISSTKIWDLVRRNEIKHTRVGKQLRFLESDIMDMLNQK